MANQWAYSAEENEWYEVKKMKLDTYSQYPIRPDITCKIEHNVFSIRSNNPFITKREEEIFKRKSYEPYPSSSVFH